MKKLPISSVLASLLILSSLLLAQNPQHHYKSYYNQRFGYSISYPSDVLLPQRKADNGDGRAFVSKDGRAEMRVYGGHNVFDQTISQLYQEELRGGLGGHTGRVVTYKILQGNWFVISGYEGEKIFYQKTIHKLTGKDDQFLTFSIEYDKAQKKIFDPITAVISKSFKL